MQTANANRKSSKNKVIAQKELESITEDLPHQNKKKHHHHKDRESKTKQARDDTSQDDNADRKGNRQIKDLIAEKFVLLKEIGHGAFGQIFLSFNMRDNIEVAIKKEVKSPQKIPQLRTEAKIYQTLLNIPLNVELSGALALQQEEVQGIPKFYGMGELPDSYYLIIEFLGPNLIELMNYCGNKRFTIATVCLLGLQKINRIENLHKHHFLHRDIKPENFLIGTEDKSNVVYLIDFGLSKRYKNPKNHQHIPYREGRFLTGTARYVSINTHLGIEQSRRDDLESIGYVLVFFLKGSLPWQGLKGGNDKYTRIMEKKLQIPTEILCYGLPDEFSSYLNYCKSLRFEDRPDYDYLRGLFIRLLGTCTCVYGITREYLKFDWCFEDQNMLWNFYLGENKTSMVIANEAQQKTGLSNNSNKQDNVKDSNKAKEQAEQGKNEEANELFKKGDNEESNEKTNENNPNIQNSKDSSGEIISKESISLKADSQKDSDDTIKVEFNGQCQSEVYNSHIRDAQVKNIFTDYPIEDIDSYINNLMQGCKLKTAITIGDIKKRTTINTTNKSDDTIEGKHKQPKNITQILNKVKENANDMSASEDSVSLFNEKRNRQKKEKENKSNISNNKEIDNDNEEEQPNKPFKELSRKVIIHSQGEDTFENLINPKFKSKKSDYHEMRLTKENLIRLTTEPISKYYMILNDIGQGSYGKVKRVKHRHLNEIRAMKIVNKKSQSSSNEIEILRKISHPNIINIFEIFEDSMKFSIMSEYCEGGELFDAITKRGYFTELDTAKIMKQILQAVNYLHDNNIIHRDLKPENIMLLSNSSNLDLKLIDFGTAVEKPAKGKKLKKFIGTSYYIAPEVINECYDEKCDVWSCGIILFILLCGYPPFNGSTNAEIYHAIKLNNITFMKDEWSDVSKDAISLIHMMLNKLPEKRPTAEECLNHPWFKHCLTSQSQSKESEAAMKKNKKQIIDKMSVFVQENRFKQAVLQFITTEFNLKKEEEEMKKLFKEFDKEDKGTISKEVFLSQLEKIYGENLAKEITSDIFAKLDLDGSGAISYNEFLTSIIDSKKIITIDKLEKAFKLFDKDENGLLSVGEIKSFFGGDEVVWKNVLKEVDTNGDGEVDFEEFKSLMMGINTDQIVGNSFKG